MFVPAFVDSTQARQPIQPACLNSPSALPAYVATPAAKFCPIPNRRLLIRGLRTGMYRFTEIGLEKRCSQCREFWPGDTEFYFASAKKGSGLTSYCKACYGENYYRRKT